MRPSNGFAEIAGAPGKGNRQSATVLSRLRLPAGRRPARRFPPIRAGQGGRGEERLRGEFPRERRRFRVRFERFQGVAAPFTSRRHSKPPPDFRPASLALAPAVLAPIGAFQRLRRQNLSQNQTRPSLSLLTSTFPIFSAHPFMGGRRAGAFHDGMDRVFTRPRHGMGRKPREPRTERSLGSSGAQIPGGRQVERTPGRGSLRLERPEPVSGHVKADGRQPFLSRGVNLATLDLFVKLPLFAGGRRRLRPCRRGGWGAVQSTVF